MRIETPGRPHLTYCTNIHPAESWDEVDRALRTHLPAVKARVAPNDAFGVGLRLSGRAAAELERGEGVRGLRDWLRSEGLYVFTINGFPYGRFHEVRVKEDVYRPDWLEPARLEYTNRLARLLAGLLPEGVEGSISTVPGAFRPRVTTDAERRVIARALVACVATLVKLFEETGRVVTLALEPEPHCFLETTDEAVDFFERFALAPGAEEELVERLGVSRHRAAELLRRHLGLCLDACHAAVEYESVDEVLDRLSGAGVSIHKIQVTAGLELDTSDAPPREILAPFGDDVYLHQVVVRRASKLRRFLDLSDAFSDPTASNSGSTWRVHFHVPVFAEAEPPLRTTQAFVRELLSRVRDQLITPHLEVETYTWGVLPAALRQTSISDAIARELEWTLAELS